MLAAGAGLLLSACGDSESATTTTRDDEAPAPQDLEILAFALSFEYVEAAFFERLVDEDVLASEDQEIAKAVAEHEAEHVEALEGALEKLGGRRPTPLRPDFEALLAGDPEAVLVRAADLQGLVAAAYLGQAARIQDDTVLETALRVHAVEARHAAALGRRVGRSFAPAGALAEAMDAARARAELERYLL